MFNFKQATHLTLAAAGAVTLFLASCSKSNEDVAAPQSLSTIRGGVGLMAVIPDGDSANITGPGVTSGKIYRNGSVYTVKNFRQAYSTGEGQPADGNFYWRFTVNEAGPSTNYNIKFSGIATGDITSNDSLKFKDKTFSTVTAADWSSASNPLPSPAGSNVIGMNQVTGTGVPPSVAAYANGAGWYIYGWSTGHTVTPVAGRTLFWKSGATIYAFEITSIYQNGVTGGAFPYYNFRYKAL